MKGTSNMEVIMAQIREHLLPTIDHGAKGNVHHYNRVWEKISVWASKPPNQEVAIDTKAPCGFCKGSKKGFLTNYCCLCGRPLS